jgi:cobalamin-dependent methionine synthase I
MTLKEKFEEYTDQKSWQKENYDAIECEVIADEFAIDFAEWYLSLWLTDNDSSFDNYSPTELLEIYKKEKGL